MRSIASYYFTFKGITEKQEKKMLARVIGQTDFIPQKLLSRGRIYDRNKVRTALYKGLYKEKPAVLKIHILKPETDEAEILEQFNAQNESLLIRLPRVYVDHPWNIEEGFGYIITEYIDASPIFEMPFANEAQMQIFGTFYQNYRTRALRTPWVQIAEDGKNTVNFVLGRITTWQKICEAKGRLKKDDYKSYLDRFTQLAKRYFGTIEMVFCHGHLTPNDIYTLPDGTFVLMSNLFWSHRPEWYDLAFNIWSCLLHIRDTDYTFERMVEYVNRWLEMYRRIPIVREDQDFDRKLYIVLLERTLGAILVDLGVNDFYGEEKNRPYFEHLLKLHQQWFNCLAKKLE